MNRTRFLFASFLLTTILISLGLGFAQSPTNNPPAPTQMPQMRSTTMQQRKDAAARAAQRRASQPKAPKSNKFKSMAAPTGAGAPPALTLDQLYFGTYPNYANSPLPAVTVDPATGAVTGVTPKTGIRKFVDTLPGLNTPNNLGQQIPIAVPDITTFPGSDYYEIGLVQYQEQMHSDLPSTTLRGYVQLMEGTPSPNIWDL